MVKPYLKQTEIQSRKPCGEQRSWSLYSLFFKAFNLTTVGFQPHKLLTVYTATMT